MLKNNRLLTLFVTIVIGIYLTIIIANMGGYVDQIMRSDIRENVMAQVMNNPANKSMSTDVKKKLAEETIKLQEKRLGLDTPVAIRNFQYLTNALQMNLGRAINMSSDSGSRQVRLIILERLGA